MEKGLKDDGVLVAGFDPLHNGHLWLIEQGILKYNQLYVAVSQNIGRNYEFSIDERLEMLTEITKPYGNTIIDCLKPGQFSVDYAREKGARYILRGLRNIDDFVNEQDMYDHNRRFAPEIMTDFLMAPEENRIISSTRIRELVHLQPWEERVIPLVPGFVYEKLLERYGNAGQK